MSQRDKEVTTTIGILCVQLKHLRVDVDQDGTAIQLLIKVAPIPQNISANGFVGHIDAVTTIGWNDLLVADLDRFVFGRVVVQGDQAILVNGNAQRSLIPQMLLWVVFLNRVLRAIGWQIQTAFGHVRPDAILFFVLVCGFDCLVISLPSIDLRGCGFLLDIFRCGLLGLQLATLNLAKDLLGRLKSSTAQSLTQRRKELLHAFKQRLQHPGRSCACCIKVAKRISNGFLNDLSLRQAHLFVGFQTSHDLVANLRHLTAKILVDPNIFGLLFKSLPLRISEEAQLLHGV